MSKTRTFIAIPAADQVYAQALATIKSLRAHTDNVRWTIPENLHWTLQFMGEVDDTDVYEICREVGRAAAEMEPFSFAGLSIQAFPKNEKPRTIWLGAGEGGEQLCTLQRKIEDRMSDLGFRPERQRFTPHLTLGRVLQGSHAGEAIAQQLTQLADLDGGVMEVDEVIVFGSELTREGPTYHQMGSSYLGKVK